MRLDFIPNFEPCCVLRNSSINITKTEYKSMLLNDLETYSVCYHTVYHYPGKGKGVEHIPLRATTRRGSALHMQWFSGSPFNLCGCRDRGRTVSIVTSLPVLQHHGFRAPKEVRCNQFPEHLRHLCTNPFLICTCIPFSGLIQEKRALYMRNAALYKEKQVHTVLGKGVYPFHSQGRVINFKFLLQPQIILHHTVLYEELGFSSLTQMKHDYTPILTPYYPSLDQSRF